MTLIPPDAGIQLRQFVEPPQLQPAARSQGIPADLPDLAPGQTFSARIDEALPGNMFRALVAGRELLLQLPQGARTGDTLELVVVDRMPRMLVAHLAEPDAAAGGLAGVNEPYKFADISRAARMIVDLLPNEGEAPAPARLNRGEPLLDKPPASAAEIAPALQQAIKNSGLFYESHQAQWLVGKLPLEQLLSEPQGQLSKNPTPMPPGLQGNPAVAATLANNLQSAATAGLAGAILAAATDGAGLPQAAAAPPPGTAGAAVPLAQPGEGEAALLAQVDADGLASTPAAAAGAAAMSGDEAAHSVAARLYEATASPVPGAIEPLRAERAPAAQASATAAGAAAAGQPNTPPAVPDQLRPLVQQQLDAIASQRLLWHGEAWPNQPIDWEVAREDEHGAAARPDDETAVWRTSLRLEMPRLGLLGATLRLSPQGLQVALTSSSEASAFDLNAAAPELTDALNAAGVRVLTLRVNHAARAE